jgi:hypothetical protein
MALKTFGKERLTFQDLNRSLRTLGVVLATDNSTDLNYSVNGAGSDTKTKNYVFSSEEINNSEYLDLTICGRWSTVKYRNGGGSHNVKIEAYNGSTRTIIDKTILSNRDISSSLWQYDRGFFSYLVPLNNDDRANGITITITLSVSNSTAFSDYVNSYFDLDQIVFKTGTN